MNPKTHAHISVSAATYARLAAAREARGLSITAIVEAALAADLQPVDAPAVPVTLASYVAIGKAARAQWRPFSEVLDEALNRALDDAERFPAAAKRARRAPMVAHASRRTA